MTRLRLGLLCIVFLPASLFVLTTCGKDSPTQSTPEPPPPPPPPPVATRIEVTPSSATLNAIGQTVRLTARVIDQNGSAISGASVTWTSGAVGVATVGNQGLVTAVKNGSAVITARSGSVSATASITVSQTPGRIVIEPQMATLMSISETVQLTATVQDRNQQPVAGAEVTWQSSDEGIASVSDDGLVTAVGNGTVRITARSGNVSASIDVKVMQEAASIEIEPQTATLTSLGETVQLTVIVLDQKERPVEGAAVTWQSSDENVATVSDQGLVAAVGNGAAVITARSGSASASIEVAVMAPNPDREVLAMLYDATNGPDWTVDTNWLTDAPLSEWHGVTTNSSERVVILNLWTNNLSGEIPAEVGQLTYIEELNLGSNEISGEIPASIGQLANLGRLNLSNNNLSGGIPASMGQLSNLTELKITWNELTGSLPAELGQLIHLDWLAFHNNRLSGELPAELGQLSNLTRLDIGDNQFSGEIPATFGQMANLLVLGLENNNLSGEIPAELGRLARLEILALPDNQLTGVPPSELGNLSNLRSLLLENNSSMSGPLPDSFTNLDLGILKLGGTGLCVPASPEFQTWLQGIRIVTAATCPDPESEP